MPYASGLTCNARSFRHSRPRSPKNAYPRSTYAMSGHRFYKPEISRWISRDPVGEKGGGIGLYVFSVNQPSDSVDVLGLEWRYTENTRKRRGKPRATMKCDCEDTAEDLARILGLNASVKEYNAWLRPEDNGGMPKDKDEKLGQTRIFSVPNKAIIDLGIRRTSWAQLGHFALFVNLVIDVGAAWERQGLHVEVNYRLTGSSIKADMGDKDLYRFFYFGEGDLHGGLLPGKRGHDGTLVEGSYTAYGIERMILLACETIKGATV